MRTLVLIFISIVSGFGQDEIDNAKTDKHKQIPGTKFFLVPPIGFINATNFQGKTPLAVAEEKRLTEIADVLWFAWFIVASAFLGVMTLRSIKISS